MVKRLDELYATLEEAPPPPPATPSGKPVRDVPAADKAAMAALYARGGTIRSVAAETYWSRTTVRRALLEQGVKLRPRSSWRRDARRDNDAFLYTAQLYGRGLSMQEVSEIVGVKRSTVRYRLIQMDVKIRPQGANLRWARQRRQLP